MSKRLMNSEDVEGTVVTKRPKHIPACFVLECSRNGQVLEDMFDVLQDKLNEGQEHRLVGNSDISG